jgi:hypothetical protein
MEIFYGTHQPWILSRLSCLLARQLIPDVRSRRVQTNNNNNNNSKVSNVRRKIDSDNRTVRRVRRSVVAAARDSHSWAVPAGLAVAVEAAVAEGSEG